MPLRIDRTPAAKRDVFDIWDYIAPNSPKGAERALRTIRASISMLAEQPDAGRDRSELGDGLRSFPVGSYVVFYRHTAKTLTVFRILHSARHISPEILTE